MDAIHLLVLYQVSHAEKCLELLLGDQWLDFNALIEKYRVHQSTRILLET